MAKRLHPLVREMRTLLKAMDPQGRPSGRVEIGPAGSPCIAGSKEDIPDAIALLQEIVIAAERNGLSYETTRGRRRYAKRYFKPARHKDPPGPWIMNVSVRTSSGVTPEPGTFEISAFQEEPHSRRAWKTTVDAFTQGMIAEEVAVHIRDVYRVQREERRKRYRLAAAQKFIDAKWREERRQLEHVQTTEALVEIAGVNLGHAERMWREHLDLTAFVAECRRRWEVENGQLSKTQKAWVEWASAEASRHSPFAVGYPDPALDGPIETTGIPVGGPYPDVRKFGDAGSPMSRTCPTKSPAVSGGAWGREGLTMPCRGPASNPSPAPR